MTLISIWNICWAIILINVIAIWIDSVLSIDDEINYSADTVGFLLAIEDMQESDDEYVQEQGNALRQKYKGAM